MKAYRNRSWPGLTHLSSWSWHKTAMERKQKQTCYSGNKFSSTNLSCTLEWFKMSMHYLSMFSSYFTFKLCPKGNSWWNSNTYKASFLHTKECSGVETMACKWIKWILKRQLWNTYAVIRNLDEFTTMKSLQENN